MINIEDGCNQTIISIVIKQGEMSNVATLFWEIVLFSMHLVFHIRLNGT